MSEDGRTKASKIDTGAHLRTASAARTLSKVPRTQVPGGQYRDIYGRDAHHTTVRAIYPGSADCHMCGYIASETNLRPTYANAVGAYGNADYMSCEGVMDAQARHECEMNNARYHHNANGVLH
jgi:hypothetical protein